MRYKMELEKRKRAGLWSDGALSDAGRDHLDASAARSLTANTGLRFGMDQGFKERSPLSDHRQLLQRMGSGRAPWSQQGDQLFQLKFRLKL